MSQQLQFLIFLTVWCLILAAVYALVGWRLISTAQLPQPWQTVAWSGFVILYLLPVGTFTAAVSRLEHPAIDLVAWGSYAALAWIVFALSLVAVRDLLYYGSQGVVLLISAVSELTGSRAIGAEVFHPGRRLFLMQASDAGIVTATAVMTAYGMYEARRPPGVVEVEVPIRNLPEAFDGFRIVQLTDIHAGLTVRRPFVETAVRTANALRPDLIVFTGDLVDGSVPHLRNDVEPMKDLTASHGVCFITGNHEYYSGVGPWLDHVTHLGMHVLLNTHHVIRKNGSALVVAGVPDVTGVNFEATHRSDPALALVGAPDGPRVLLAHQPKSVYAASRAGFDLMLSGHTHGGQFFPWNYAVALDQPYVSGLHRHDGMWVYVSKGTGYWGPPVRLGVRSEITAITLRKAPAT